jgi:LacI family transcriptional regulator
MADDRARLNLKSLARHLDLSVTTVSRALRNGPEVRRETIERVKKAAEELGYVRDLGGLTLRTGLSYSICVLITAPPIGETADTGTIALLQGVHEVAADAGYSVTAVPIDSRQDPIETLRGIIDGRRSDGLIFDYTEPMDARVRFLLERDFPFVTFGRTELFTPHCWFDVDDQDATYRSARYLIERGYKRICLLNPPPGLMFSQYRLRGYRRALAEAGLTIDPELIVEQELNARLMRATTARIMSIDNPPDSFIYANDVTVLGAMAGLRDIGRNPADFGMVGCNATLLTEYIEPRPASFYFPLLEAGRRLAHLLLKRLAGGEVSQLQELAQTELRAP